MIGSKEICRISTQSQNGWPHTVPVGYVFLDEAFYVPATRDSKKIRNLQTTSKATIVIDDETAECGIMIECSSTVLEGPSAKPLKDYMTNVKGWQNDDGDDTTVVVIKLDPIRKSSWGLPE